MTSSYFFSKVGVVSHLFFCLLKIFFYLCAVKRCNQQKYLRTLSGSGLPLHDVSHPVARFFNNLKVKHYDQK